MSEMVIRVVMDSADQNTGPRAGSQALPDRNLGAGRQREKIELDPKISSTLNKKLMKEKYSSDGLDLSSITTSKTRGIFRNSYTKTVGGIDGPISASTTGQLFEKGTWFEENNIGKKTKGLAIAAAREVINTSVSIQKYQSSNSMKNHELDKDMKLINYGASIGMAMAVNPVLGATVAAGIALSEIGNYIQQKSEYKYDMRLAGQNRETVRAASGNLSYGRPRGD